MSGNAAQQDSAAESLARIGQTAAEVVATGDGGSYASITGPASLVAIEHAIPTTAGGIAHLSAPSGNATGYTVTATSKSGDTFSVLSANSRITRTCTGSASLACQSGSW